MYDSQREWRATNKKLILIYAINRHQNQTGLDEDIQKKRCRYYFNRALKYGLIVRRKACSECHRRCKPDGHHEDYFKPLDAQWLCRSCHIKADRAREDRLGITRKHRWTPHLTERQVKRLYSLIDSGMSQRQTAAVMGITTGAVSRRVKHRA